MAGEDVPQGDQIHVDLDPVATLAAYARHRRRFAEEVQALDEPALAVRSRCSEWSVADVLRHGADVDEWMQAIWTGKALPFSSFDPNTTPMEFVVTGRALSDIEARDRYVASSEMMAAGIGESGTERWGLPSFSPLGAVPWWLSALHVFYDSWVHERDVLLPLGIDPPVNTDEAVPVLVYSLAIVGTLIREPTDTVVAGMRLVTGEMPVRVTRSTPEGDLAAIIDALSGRGSIADCLDGTDPETIHRLGALDRMFHTTKKVTATERGLITQQQ